jgi:hypothetical protein
MCTTFAFHSTHTNIRIINQIKEVFLEMLIVNHLVKRDSWNIMESNTDHCPQQSTLSHAISLRFVLSNNFLHQRKHIMSQLQR